MQPSWPASSERQLCRSCAENPRLLHYGLDMVIRNDDDQVVYRWGKAAHHGFDALACPPWDLAEQPARRGLFPHPPLASSLTGRVRSVLLASAFAQSHNTSDLPRQLTSDSIHDA